MTKSDLIIIRPGKSQDINFIMATFRKGLYYGESWFTIIDKEVFMKHYTAVINYIISKPSTIVKVACLKEDEDTIVGYSISEENKLHWVFVKKPWRSIGIARDLVSKDIKTVTHLTKAGLSIINKYKIDFNPFDV